MKRWQINTKVGWLEIGGHAFQELYPETHICQSMAHLRKGKSFDMI